MCLTLYLLRSPRLTRVNALAEIGATIHHAAVRGKGHPRRIFDLASPPGGSMDYKSIIVFLDSGSRSDARIDFAIDIAQKNGAHLSGVHVDYGPGFPVGLEPGAAVVIARLEEYLSQQRAPVERRFVEAAQRAG